MQIIQIAILQKPWDFWAGKALKAQTRNCLNIKLAQKWNFCQFLNICRQKFSGFTIKLLHIFMQRWGMNFIE